MKEHELDFEVILDGHLFLVEYSTAGKNLATLKTILLNGFPLDIAELVTTKEHEKFVISIQYAMRNNCNNYWEEQLNPAA